MEHLFRLLAATAVIAAACLFWVATAAAQEQDPGDVTAAPDEDGSRCGIIAYDWDGPVEKASHGFPSEKPPRENYNWKNPINFAEGELFFRAEIFNQPKAQEMRLQLCFWQPEVPGGNQYKLETCGPAKTVIGENGQVVTWSREVARLWKKDGIGVNWKEPRSRASVAIKNSSGLPVSNYNDWNWNGEDPDKWYPLDMRFTAVVVPQGGEFCGWDYYLAPTAVQMASFGVSSPGASWQAPAAVTLLLVLMACATLLASRRRRPGAD